jgi:DMSO reductase family type II enzyme chaperone
MVQIEDLSTPEELATASRSRLYQLLERAFLYPEADFHAEIRDGSFGEEVSDVVSGLPYALPATAADASLGSAPESCEDLQAEYVRLFEVGVGAPPCPLYGGLYARTRKKAMEEVCRFYEYFGLRLPPKMQELPDHVTAELEFLHFLTFREVAALHQGKDRASYLRAQRDFLERHPGRWVPLLARRLAGQSPLPFFAGLVALTEAFLTQEKAYVRALTRQ